MIVPLGLQGPQNLFPIWTDFWEVVAVEIPKIRTDHMLKVTCQENHGSITNKTCQGSLLLCNPQHAACNWMHWLTWIFFYKLLSKIQMMPTWRSNSMSGSNQIDTHDVMQLQKTFIFFFKWDNVAFGSGVRMKKQAVSRTLDAHHSSCLCHQTMSSLSWIEPNDILNWSNQKIKKFCKQKKCICDFVDALRARRTCQLGWLAKPKTSMNCFHQCKTRKWRFTEKVCFCGLKSKGSKLSAENLTMWVLVLKWFCKDAHAETNADGNFSISFAHQLMRVAWWPFVQISECCRLVSVLDLCPFSV